MIVFTNVLEVNATVNGVPLEFMKGCVLVVGSIFQDELDCRSYHENNWQLMIFYALMLYQSLFANLLILILIFYNCLTLLSWKGSTGLENAVFEQVCRALFQILCVIYNLNFFSNFLIWKSLQILSVLYNQSQVLQRLHVVLEWHFFRNFYIRRSLQILNYYIFSHTCFSFSVWFCRGTSFRNFSVLQILHILCVAAVNCRCFWSGNILAVWNLWILTYLHTSSSVYIIEIVL